MSISNKLEKYNKFSSEQLLHALSFESGENNLMADILSCMGEALDDVKRRFFQKPVVSVPFGVKPEHARQLATQHPEVREIIYEPHQMLPDGLFLGVKHFSVRRVLTQLLSGQTSIIEDRYAQALILEGVDLANHSFVWRTAVPIDNWQSITIGDISRYYIIVDLYNSMKELDWILTSTTKASAAETIFVTPFDAKMWAFLGGVNTQAAYMFEWSDNPYKSCCDGYKKPIELPHGFFYKRRYDSWKLYIQPIGAAEAMVLSRRQFLMLMGGLYVPLFHEVRLLRNGFAEVSFIRSINYSHEIRTQLTPELLRHVHSDIPLGHVVVPRLFSQDVLSQFTSGRQFDLHSELPCVVRKSYYDSAMKLIYTLQVGRDVISAMMRMLHKNSAKLIYNGAIVTVDRLVDVETMCVVLEYTVTTNLENKLRLAAVTGLARTPYLARPTDYAKAVLTWAGQKAAASADLNKGAANVANYLSDIVASKPFYESTQLDDDVGLQYGDVDVHIDPEKENLVEKITDYAEELFGYNYTQPYNISRQDIVVNKPDVIKLRMELVRYKNLVIDVNQVQAIYDDIFPGNSTIFPTENQQSLEQGDFKFTIDVQNFRMALPGLFSATKPLKVLPSLLRTSVGADLVTSSFRSMIGSLMKRNFNRPRPEAPGARATFVKNAISQSLLTHGHKRAKYLREYYKANKIVVTKNVVEMWAAKHTNADVISAATMLEQQDPDPSMFKVMPKDVPKPAMSTTAQGSIAVGQTVVFHSKDVIALTAGLFTTIVTRLLTFFDDNIRFAFGPDEHTSGEWADRYLDIPGVYITEIDVPKFDKTQDWACFELILHVMELVGVDQELVTFWRKASDKATVFSSLFHLTFTTMFGNRSGNAGTLATNCIVLLFAYLSSFTTASVVALLIKGDDSVLVTRRPLDGSHTQILLQDWGFSMKMLPRVGNITAFCSSFFVKNQEGYYRLVRDPLRVLEKLGRALSLEKPADYFIDYYVALVDTAISYEDDILIDNLQDAVSIYYGKPVDVVTIVLFIKHIATSSDVFLRHLYGLSQSQIQLMRDYDEVEEILLRTKSTRFIKAKQLADGHKVVRLSLIDKMKVSNAWYFD